MAPLASTAHSHRLRTHSRLVSAACQSHQTGAFIDQFLAGRFEFLRLFPDRGQGFGVMAVTHSGAGREQGFDLLGERVDFTSLRRDHREIGCVFFQFAADRLEGIGDRLEILLPFGDLSRLAARIARTISPEGSPVPVLVIPTNEEAAIAQSTMRVLEKM